MMPANDNTRCAALCEMLAGFLARRARVRQALIETYWQIKRGETERVDLHRANKMVAELKGLSDG